VRLILIGRWCRETVTNCILIQLKAPQIRWDMGEFISKILRISLTESLNKASDSDIGILIEVKFLILVTPNVRQI